MTATWRERLAVGLTRADADLSGRWATCKVGEEMAKHPGLILMAEFGPTDDILRELGWAFEEAVWRTLTGRVSAQTPEGLLDAIEDRVLELKRAS